MGVQGQNSNRNTVKLTAENGQEISGDDDVAGITVDLILFYAEL